MALEIEEPQRLMDVDHVDGQHDRRREGLRVATVRRAGEQMNVTIVAHHVESTTGGWSRTSYYSSSLTNGFIFPCTCRFEHTWNRRPRSNIRGNSTSKKP